MGSRQDSLIDTMQRFYYGAGFLLIAASFVVMGLATNLAFHRVSLEEPIALSAFGAVFLLVGLLTLGRGRTIGRVAVESGVVYIPGLHWWARSRCTIPLTSVLAVSTDRFPLTSEMLVEVERRMGRRMTLRERRLAARPDPSNLTIITNGRVLTVPMELIVDVSFFSALGKQLMQVRARTPGRRASEGRRSPEVVSERRI